MDKYENVFHLNRYQLNFVSHNYILKSLFFF